MPVERTTMFSSLLSDTLKTLFLFIFISRYVRRSALLGRSIKTLLSNLRMSAGSRLLLPPDSTSKLVAARTNTGFERSLLNPSISVRNAVNVASAPVWSSPRRSFAIASISSMNRMDGAYLRAVRKNSWTFSEPPSAYLLKNWFPSAKRNVAFDSLAIAFASIVLPVPGGP